MAFAKAGQQRVAAIRNVNRRDLLQAGAQSLSAVTLLGGILSWALVQRISEPLDLVILANAVAMPVLGAACYSVGRRRPLLAALLLLLGFWVDITAAYAGLHLWPAAYFYAVPVLAGAILLGPAVGPLGALVAVLAIALSGPAGAPSGAAILFLVICGAYSWAALRPQHWLLEWSWQASADATYLAEELRDRQGQLNRTIAALDLTNRLLQRSNHELALARQEADEARRLKDEFSNSISHELRTPLNIILGFTEIMYASPEVYGDMAWPQMLRRDIAEIRRCARYLADMVDDILDLARIEAGRMPIRREPSDLAAIISEAVEIGQRLLGDRPVKLVVELQQGLPELLLDRARIRQVLVNLLTNAVRFTQLGQIKVAAARRDKEVLVSVADTGSGIPPDQLEAIFDQFRQVDAGRRSDTGGKGLGLAIAKQFVQMHGGSIWATSRLGEGATFYFTLPLAQKDFSRSRGPTPAPLPRSPYPPSVVVLGPGESATAAASAYLRRHLDGYDVFPAGGQAELPALVERVHPRAVIVTQPAGHADNVEPPLSAALPAGTPVLHVSLPVVVPPTGSDGFAAYLTKPVSGEQLLPILRRLAPSGEILVVDDDRSFVQLVLRLLQASGCAYETRTAYNGEEALRKMRQHAPSAVILDMVMPHLGGHDVVAAMRAQPELAAVPVIAVSGADAGHDSPPAPAPSLFLRKPAGLREGEVLALIKSTLEIVRPDYVAATSSEAAT